ncbi:DMT family transporter [Rubellimicrobium sp. CFH 75288]|uniref:DMT family transporter n=1 Tax=Rubellimicrobium sp. CFH 75288 TaxID=2697034 RepID=UPI001411F823|nr:DMT family transporter [Rubellimicrobium sp. CFH 75288]NAZ37336.1 EamA family transporter [Rubellimicrobium sp. CFH 75288]
MPSDPPAASPVPAAQAGRPLLGIALKLGSVLVFTAMAALIKATSEHVPAGQAVFFRSFFATPVILVWLLWRGDFPRALATRDPLGHFWRAFVGTLAMGLGFAGLGLLPLPEVTALGYAAPLLVVVFGAMFLGERVRKVRLGAVALGLAGVLVVLWPRLSAGAGAAEALGAVVTLMGAVFAALAQVFVRRLTMTEGTAAIVWWFSVTSAVLALLTLPFGWVLPAPREALLLVCAGLLGGLGQILLTAAYRNAEAGLVAPFDYASMLLAVAIGWWIFGELPTGTTVAGAALVIAAGVLIIWRERQLGLRRARTQPLTPPGG